MEAQALLEDRAGSLYFSYQITSKSGRILVAPSQLLTGLVDVLKYKVEEKVSELDTRSWRPVLHGFLYILVYGEGLVDESDKCHVLRPLNGNTLGRCAVIANMRKRHGAFVRTETELKIFARFWAKHRDTRLAADDKIDYYTLIS